MEDYDTYIDRLWDAYTSPTQEERDAEAIVRLIEWIDVVIAEDAS